MENFKPEFARLKRCAAFTDVSESALAALARTDPTFPKPIKLGPQTLVYHLPEITAWMLKQQRHDRPVKPADQ